VTAPFAADLLQLFLRRSPAGGANVRSFGEQPLCAACGSGLRPGKPSPELSPDTQITFSTDGLTMKTHKNRDPQEVLQALEGFLAAGDGESHILLDMLHSVVRFMNDGPDRGDMKMLHQAFKELRYGLKVFAPYRHVRKVSVFGSARTAPEAMEFEQARKFANLMARSGWMVITGAGPGIMEAAQGGAGRAHSFGVNIRLPFEQEANDVIAKDPKLVNFKYFFTRKVMFVKEADAIALFPGGFGTHDELFESLTLIQTGKCQPLPVVLVDTPGGSYWEDWKGYIEGHLRERGLIDERDTKLFEVTHDLDRAVEIVQSFYRNYDSLRFVRNRLVLRVKRPVSDALLERLNVSFSDLVARGKIERTLAFAEEDDEPETRDLHRLVLDFDRKSYSRLRQLIDFLNEEPSSKRSVG
jgi:uncharacterized protein (TIGR00730 family)